MKITHTMIVMFVGSFLVQFFIMSPIMVNNRMYITNNLGKAYLATIMALFIILIQVMLHDQQYHVFSLHFYIPITALIILFIYLYRNQIAVNDAQYLASIVEHHSIDLLASEEILKKTDNYDVAKIAKNMIQTSHDNIREIRLIKNV